MSYLSPLPQQLSAGSRTTSTKTTTINEYSTRKTKTPDFDADEIFKDVKFDTPQQSIRRPLPPIQTSTQSYQTTTSSLSPGGEPPYTSPRAVGLAPPPTDQPIRHPARQGIEGEVDALTIKMVNSMFTGDGAAAKLYDIPAPIRTTTTIYNNTSSTRTHPEERQYSSSTYNRPIHSVGSIGYQNRPITISAGVPILTQTYDNCAKCSEGISLQRPGCTALNKTYHLDCFTCGGCRKRLVGGSFYTVDEQPLCEICYENSLDRCEACGKTIKDRILKASGKPFHPNCFVCQACGRCLDGVPFTVDANNTTHCVSCFHEKFAPRCTKCHRPIVPEQGKEETLRVVAMDRSYHIDCYKCEDCGLKLSSKVEGQECYPLDGQLLCKQCNSKRLRVLTEAKIEYRSA